MEREGRSSHGQANAIAAEQSSLAADEVVPNSTVHDMGNLFGGYTGHTEAPAEDSSDSSPTESEQGLSTASDISENASETLTNADGDDDISVETSSDSGALEPFHLPRDNAITQEDIDAMTFLFMGLGSQLRGNSLPFETLDDLACAMQCWSPNRISVTTLTQEAVRLQGYGRRMCTAGTDFFQEIHLLTQTFAFLQATRQCQDVSDSDRLRLFYSVLWLTELMVELISSPEEKCLIKHNHASLNEYTIFWQMEDSEALSFCQETMGQLQEIYTRNIPVTVFILRMVMTFLTIASEQPMGVCQKPAKVALVDVRLLQAKCFLATKFYENVRACCRQVLQVSTVYAKREALELWAQALLGQGRHQLALDKAIQARDAADDRIDRERLEKWVVFLRKSVAAEKEKELQRNSTKEPQKSWLEGTNACRRSGSVQSREGHRTRSKSRHRRPKARQQNDGFYRSQSTSTYQRQHIPTRQSQQALYANFSASASQTPASSLLASLPTADFLDAESSDSDLETVSSEEPAVKLNLDHFRQRREKYQVPTCTWFEESQTPPKTAAKPRSKSKTDLDSFDEVEVLKLHPMEVAKFEEKSSQLKSIYAPMKSRVKLVELLRREPERYKHCKLRITSAHSAQCRVVGESGEDALQLEVCGRSRVGQTYNDDEVVVEVLSSPEEKEGPVYGKVVGIMKRHRHDGVDHPIFACVMDQYESQLMHPLCKTVPKVHVLNPKLKKMTEVQRRNKVEIFEVTEEGGLRSLGVTNIPAGRREEFVFRVGLIHWGEGHYYPLGVVLGMMAGGRNFPNGMRVLEFQHVVPRKFSPDCVKAVDGFRPSPLDLLKRNRSDLTELLTFTIDPPGSRDLDDALSVRKDGKLYEVGVHIADVSSVVEKGDNVDVEARRRGCTFYPPGGWRTYPMLPEPLSQGRCSLLPGEPRPTLSLLFRLDDKGEQHGQPQLCQAVIRSSRQLTYTQAQRIIDGHDEPDEHTKELFTAVQKLSELASYLRIRRLRQGAHHHRYRDPRLSGREEEEGALDAHDLVEEFMVKTNLYIAQRLLAAFPDATLLRSQDAPKADKLQKWLETGGATCHFLLALQDRMLPQGTLLSAAEYCKETSSSSQTQYLSLRRDIWYSLKLALARGDIKAATRLITIDDLHPSQLLAASRWNKLSSPAVYSCSTVPDPERNDDLEPNGHYTLQARAYCHFTSPIRRYADVVVHRMVKAMLADAQSPAYEEDEVKEIAEELTKQEVKPRHFERDCRDLHLADRLSKQPLQIVGVVGGVSTHGLDLCITGMDCPPRSLQDVPFNLLNLCSQPKVRSQAMSSEQEVTCRFRRRIYKAGEYISSNVCHRGGTKSGWSAMTAEDRIVQVNEHHLMVKVSARLWCRLLETLLSSKEGRLQSLREQVDRVGPEGEKQQRPGSRNIISCESGDGHPTTQVVTFERTFAPGQAVHLQLGAGHERSMLVPRVSLLWLSDNLHLCLDHVRDPVPQLVPQAVKAFTRAKDLEDYVDTWLPLLEMEGATEAVQGEGGVIVEDVKVSLTQDWRGDFTLQSLFCEDRCLDVGGRPQHLIKNKDICVGPCTEHVCLRIPLPGTQSSPASTSKAPRRKTTAKDGCDQTAASKAGEKEGRMKDTVTSSPTRPLLTEKGQLWIGHGRVVSVCGEAEEMVKVTFELRREFIPPPRCLVDVQHVTGTVEILPVPETQRRPAAVLQELLAREAENEAEKEQNERLAHDLARAIALRRDIPVLEKSRLRQAEEIEKDLKPRPLDLPLNNPSQEDAITKSLKSTFSLIHGPPGTGKSYTGVKLVYLFYKINTKLQEKEGAKKQILFCGPSNKSVDVAARLAKKYLSKMTPSPKIARMYGKSMEELDFPVPGRTLLRKGGGDRKCDPDLHDITIHHIIRKAVMG